MLERLYVRYALLKTTREELTGALGLITTLGGSCPCRFGVPGPEEFAGLTFMVELNRSGALSVLWPGLRELIDPDCGCGAGLEFAAPPSFGGRGLFRGSLSAVVEDDGVATGD